MSTARRPPRAASVARALPGASFGRGLGAAPADTATATTATDTDTGVLPAAGAEAGVAAEGGRAAPAARRSRRPRAARASPAERANGTDPAAKRGRPPRATGPRGKAQSLAPDPAHLSRAAGGRWRVRLADFALSGSVAGSPARLRELLGQKAAELADFGAEAEPAALPDDLLVAAAAGALACMPFLDILDGGCFAQAPCLCCYAAHSTARAREAGAALLLFQRYYDGPSYLASRAYVRAVAALTRDMLEDEVAEVASFLAGLDSTSEGVREINGRWAGRMCVAVPPCQPGALWVYSTADGRRLLRHLARGFRKGGAPVKVAVASSDPAVYPRYRFRMYAATLAGTPEPQGAALLEAALSWSRAHDPSPRGSGPPRERDPGAQRPLRAPPAPPDSSGFGATPRAPAPAPAPAHGRRPGPEAHWKEGAHLRL